MRSEGWAEACRKPEDEQKQHHKLGKPAIAPDRLVRIGFERARARLPDQLLQRAERA